MDRRIGLLYQNRGKLLIDPSAGHPLKISIKLFSRIGGKVQLLKHRIVNFRQECANLICAGKNPTEAGMGIARIATKLRLRRILSQHNFGRAGLLGRYGWFDGGAAAADNNDWYVFNPHDPAFMEMGSIAL